MGFSNIHSVAKCRGDPLEKTISKKKSRSAKKNERGDPLVSPGMVCYAEKQEKPFLFSSLGQIVPFGAIIICRTFKKYFGQFVWIEKKSHYNSRVSLHEVPTKNGSFTIWSFYKIQLINNSSYQFKSFSLSSSTCTLLAIDQLIGKVMGENQISGLL